MNNKENKTQAQVKDTSAPKQAKPKKLKNENHW